VVTSASNICCTLRNVAAATASAASSRCFAAAAASAALSRSSAKPRKADLNDSDTTTPAVSLRKHLGNEMGRFNGVDASLFAYVRHHNPAIWGIICGMSVASFIVY